MKLKIYYTLLLFGLCFTFSCEERHTGHSHAEDDHIEDVKAVDPETVIITQKQFESSGYKNSDFEIRSFANTLEATGSIHLPERNKAIVSSYIGGVVNRMDLIHGQWVKKGQLLFSISNPEIISLQQEYLELQNLLPYLESENSRLEKLSNEQIAPEKDFLKASSDYKIAQTKHASIKAKVKLLGLDADLIDVASLKTSVGIFAPISGYLSEIDVVRGEFLNATVAAMEISNTNHLHMELKIMEGDISKLKKEQKVRFYVQGNIEKTYEASIHLIERLVDGDRMVNVHCHLEDESDRSLVPGMFVSAHVELDMREAISLPEESIVIMEDHHHILIQDLSDPFRYKLQQVEVGETNSGYTEILNLPEEYKNRSVLSEGAYYLIQEESTGGHSH